MLTPLLLIVVLMGKNMLELIRTYRNNFLIVLGVGVAVLLLLFLVLRWKFREPLQRYFEKYRKLLNRKILLRVLGVFLLYVVQYIISTAMYAIPTAFFMRSFVFAVSRPAPAAFRSETLRYRQRWK